MSIRPNPRGPGYEVRLRVGGERRSRSVRTLKQAETLERHWKDEQIGRRLGLPFERGPITYGEHVDRFLAQHQISAESLETLRERLVYSVRAFRVVPVRELLPEEIARWNAALPRGRATALAAMRQALSVAVRWGYLSRNPAGPDAVPMPPTRLPEIRPFESWDEVYAVADAAGRYGPFYPSLIVFACATGLRPQEWQPLECRDTDIAGRTCRVSRTLRGGAVVPAAKTHGSLRTVVLQRRVLDALSELPTPIDGRTLRFPAAGGGIINLGNFRRRVWTPALTAAGLEHRRVYETRHTFATLALSAGVPIEWISRQLGHASIALTLRHYARFLPAADARAVALLDGFERVPADRGGRRLDARADG